MYTKALLICDCWWFYRLPIGAIVCAKPISADLNEIKTKKDSVVSSFLTWTKEIYLQWQWNSQVRLSLFTQMLQLLYLCSLAQLLLNATKSISIFLFSPAPIVRSKCMTGREKNLITKHSGKLYWIDFRFSSKNACIFK